MAAGMMARRVNAPYVETVVVGNGSKCHHDLSDERLISSEGLYSNMVVVVVVVVFAIHHHHGSHIMKEENPYPGCSRRWKSPVLLYHPLVSTHPPTHA